MENETYTRVVLQIFTQTDVGTLLDALEELGPTVKYIHVDSEEPVVVDKADFARALASTVHLQERPGGLQQ